MINLSVSSRNRKRYPREIVAAEIIDEHSLQQLPRHISAPLIQSHRGVMTDFKQHDRIFQPKVCAIDACKPKKTIYQLSNRVAIEKHRYNLIANLKHRLQVAQAQGNSQLINILQDEYRQLVSSY